MTRHKIDGIPYDMEMIYKSALRMCDTPYCVQDITNKNNPLTVEVEYADLGKKKMIEMLTEWAERKEE